MNDCKDDQLYDFKKFMVPILGTFYLLVLFRTEPKHVTNMVNFYIINTPFFY